VQRTMALTVIELNKLHGEYARVADIILKWNPNWYTSPVCKLGEFAGCS